jgi:excisionase family DNA binding protein
MPELEQLLTVAEVAALTKMSESYFYKAAAAGTIPCVRIGVSVRFRPSALAAFLGGTVPGKGR